MGNTKVILNILDSALSIWKSKEATKYIDKKIKLEKEFYEEYNKPLEERSDAILDNLNLQLGILCNNTAAAIRAENSPSK